MISSLEKRNMDTNIIVVLGSLITGVLSAVVASITGLHSSRLNTLEKIVDAVQEENTRLVTQVKELREELSKVEDERDSLREERAKLISRLDAFDEKLFDMRTELETVKKERDTLANKVTELERKNQNTIPLPKRGKS